MYLGEKSMSVFGLDETNLCCYQWQNPFTMDLLLGIYYKQNIFVQVINILLFLFILKFVTIQVRHSFTV